MRSTPATDGPALARGRNAAFSAVPGAAQVAPIVVADDDEMARTLTAMLLGTLNLQNPVIAARDGGEAIELLSSCPTPALVMLDMKMPCQSGLEVLAWMRADQRLASVAVVMLTASSELAEIDQAYALGIASYLVKPVGFGAMQDVIRQLSLPWVLLAEAAPS